MRARGGPAQTSLDTFKRCAHACSVYDGRVWFVEL